MNIQPLEAYDSPNIISRPVKTGTASIGAVCRALSDILSDGVDIYRCHAAKALGHIGEKSSVDALISALMDEDGDVRSDVVNALSDIGDLRAGTAILENFLGDPNADVKINAIDALGKFKCPEVVPWLHRLVIERVDEITWDEEEFYESGWDDWLDVQVKSINILADMGYNKAIPEFLKALDDEYGQDLTEIVFKALARMGKEGISALSGFINDSDQRRRRLAVAVIGGIDSDEAADAIRGVIADPSRDVRSIALSSLARRNPGDKCLAVFFDDADLQIVADAVRLCGSEHPDKLAFLIDSQVHDVRTAVFNVVEKNTALINPDTLVEKANAEFDGPYSGPAVAAGRVLFAIDPELGLSKIIDRLDDIKVPAELPIGLIPILGDVGDERCVVILAKMLNSKDRQVRLLSLSCLCEIAGRDAVWPNSASRVILAALDKKLILPPEPDPDAEAPDAEADDVKAKPVDEDAGVGEPEPNAESGDSEGESSFPGSTLASITSNRPRHSEDGDVPQEVELTEEDREFIAMAEKQKAFSKKRLAPLPNIPPYEDIPRLAARLMGDLDHQDVVRALSISLEDDDGEVRNAAAESLAVISSRGVTFPDDVVDAILDAEESGQVAKRFFLVRAMAAANSCGKVISRLDELLNDDIPFVRVEAIRSLFSLGQPAARFKANLSDPEPAVRRIAAETVAHGDDDETIKTLVDFALSFEGYHGRHAGRLLSGIDRERANFLFLNILADADSIREWQVAIEALDELNSCENGRETTDII